MANKLFKSFFAVALVLGSALGFVACEDKGDDVVADPKVEVSATSLNFTMEEGSQSVELTANADWKVEVDDPGRRLGGPRGLGPPAWGGLLVNEEQ